LNIYKILKNVFFSVFRFANINTISKYTKHFFIFFQKKTRQKNASFLIYCISVVMKLFLFLLTLAFLMLLKLNQLLLQKI
jgi:hypothetical protein